MVRAAHLAAEAAGASLTLPVDREAVKYIRTKALGVRPLALKLGDLKAAIKEAALNKAERRRRHRRATKRPPTSITEKRWRTCAPSPVSRPRSFMLRLLRRRKR